MPVFMDDVNNMVVIPQEERRLAWLNYKPIRVEIPKPHAWTTPKPITAPVAVIKELDKALVEKPTSTHGNVGKVWMLNREKNHRVRVEADQVSKYEWMGYVRGGPRSK